MTSKHPIVTGDVTTFAYKNLLNIVLCVVGFMPSFRFLYYGPWHVSATFFTTFLLILCTVDELLKIAAMSTNGSAQVAD